MLLPEVYKHCVVERIKKKGNNLYKATWVDLKDKQYYHRKIYMGLCDFDEYEVWRYNHNLEVWEYHSQKTDFDVLSSFLAREASA